MCNEFLVTQFFAEPLGVTGTGSVNGSTTSSGITSNTTTGRVGGMTPQVGSDVNTGTSTGANTGVQTPGTLSAPGLTNNPNANAQALPDATRGMERAEDRMSTTGDTHEQATTAQTKASAKTKTTAKARAKRKAPTY